MAKYRFKTEQEFKDEGLWRTGGFPNTWNSSKKMNQYLGQDVPEQFNKDCDAGKTVFLGDWTFNLDSYTLNSLVGRYIKYAKYNPGTSSSGYEKIIQDDPIKYNTVELEYYGSCARSRLTDGDFTLMPVGFTPHVSKSDPDPGSLDIKTLEGRWVRWNIKFSGHIKKYNIGDCSRIEKVFPGVRLEGDTYLFGTVRLKDGDWEIMPEGFTPPTTGSLPEKWCVRITETNKEVLDKWRRSKSDFMPYGDFRSWLTSEKRDGSYCHWGPAEKDGFTEISYEDFLKLNSVTVSVLEQIPEKWAVKVDGPSSETKYAELLAWRSSDSERAWIKPGYIHSDLYHKETLRENFVEITLDQFLENVWKKPLLKLSSSSSSFDDIFVVGKKLRDIPLVDKSITCYKDGEGKTVFSTSGYNLTGLLNCEIRGVTKDYFDVSGFGFGWFKKSDALESSSSIGVKGMDSYALSRFPASGCYNLSNPKIEKLLDLLQDTRPSHVIRETAHKYVAWNEGSYWYVKGLSGKTEYSYADLSPFLDTQSGESSSPKVESSDTPVFIKGRWYKNLGGSQNYAGCFDYLQGDERFYMQAHYNFDDKIFKKGSNSWLHYKNAVECTEEDLKIIFASNPTENPMYVKPIPEYVKGKWYSLPQWGNQSFIKFDYLDDRRAYYTECIHDRTYRKNSDWWSTSGNTLEVPSMQEVSKYLPEGHPDKIKPKVEFIPGKWYKSFTFKGTIAKYKKTENKNDFVGSEWINDKGTYYKEHFTGTIKDHTHEINVSEIQHLLPDGHPEKTQEVMTKKYSPDTGRKVMYQGDMYEVATCKKNNHAAIVIVDGPVCSWEIDQNIIDSTNFYDCDSKYHGKLGYLVMSGYTFVDDTTTPSSSSSKTLSVSGINLNIFFETKNASEANSVLDYLKSKGEKVFRGYSWGNSWSYIGYRKMEDAWSVTELYNHNNLSSNPYVVKGEDFLPKTTSTCPFKVGDKIIGTSDGVYGVTDKGWVGEVIKIYDSEHEDIQVGGIGLFERGPFTVQSRYFRIATSTEISFSSVEKKKTSTESIINVAKGDLPQTIKVKDRPII